MIDIKTVWKWKNIIKALGVVIVFATLVSIVGLPEDIAIAVSFFGSIAITLISMNIWDMYEFEVIDND